MLATHSGKFHADEALAVYLLRKLPEYATMPLVRTRDPAVIATATIVVDVGAVYDPPTHRYDHHQRSFTDCWPGRKIRLSSAGLVYKHFGSRIIDQALLQKSLDTPTSVILERVYDQLIMAFDGVDNGVPQYETSAPPAYKSSTSISDRVERLNPDWNQVCTEQETLALFEQAVALTGIEFEHALSQCLNSWIPAQQIVTASLKSSLEIDASGRILVLDEYCPWKSALDDLPPAASQKLLYVLFGDSTGSGYRVQAVAVHAQSFESRKALPEPWRGMRDEQLDEITGICGGVFCHASGFILGAKSRDAALALARKACDF